jgi:adenylate kinase
MDLSITHSKLPQLVILYGMPGSGKGTQAKLLEQKFGYEFLDFGQNFREFAKKANNPDNKDYIRACRVQKDLKEGRAILTQDLYYIIQNKIESLLKSGQKIVLDKPGSLLEEAIWLSSLIVSNKVSFCLVHIILDQVSSLNRIANRFYIPSSKTPYPSYQDALNQAIDNELPYQRPEDEDLEVTKTRINNLYGSHQQILDVYKQKKLKVAQINGSGTVEDVFDRLFLEISK